MLNSERFDTLWVIEAPGKVHILEKTLHTLGYDARVIATKGHFMKMPDSLSFSGINQDFIEVDRLPAHPDIVKRLRGMARLCRQVIIATDADTEGDVIAWDVQSVLKEDGIATLRVKLRALDEVSLSEALSSAGPVMRQDAVPGRTRAIIDRLIGSAHMETGVGAGRISSAILAVIKSRKPHLCDLTLTARAKDGGRPWKATTPIKPPLTLTIAKSLSELVFPSLDFKSETPLVFEPSHMGDIMMRSAAVLGMKPKDTARAMQVSYESGRLSYPRSGSRGMSRAAARKIEKILKKAGQRFAEAKVPDKREDDIHDAPYPIGFVDVTLNPERMGEVEGVRTLIARDLVKTGQKHTKEIPDKALIRKYLTDQGFTDDIADFVAEMDWHREVGPTYPGKETWAESVITHRMPEAAILEACLEAKLGKPSTWSGHIEKFMERELVDPTTLELTEKGQDWYDRTPRYLLNTNLTRAIEMACEKGRSEVIQTQDGQEPWEALAGRLVGAMPEELRNTLLKTLQHREKSTQLSAIDDSLNKTIKTHFANTLG